MAYPISDVTRRVVYTGSAGVGPYSFTFEVLANTDIQVYKNTTLLTLTTNYTVTINANGTGSVTLVVAATNADNITIVGDRAIQRATDFVTGGDLFANTLNDEFDSLVIFSQQVDEKADRGLKAPVTDPTDVNMVLPVKATRLGTVLAFNATTGNPEAGPSIASVTTVAAQSANINTVAGISANVTTVAGISANVTTVAGVSSAVTTVAGISANVTTVAGISSNVTTVATNNTNINTVAGVSASVTAVAGISGNVTTVAGISGNVTTVAGISADVTTVAGASSAVTTNATNIASINTNATNIAVIQSASTNATNAANSATAAASSATSAAAAAASGMYSAVQDKSANYTVVVGDAGDLLRVTTTAGAVTITLPAISSLSDGFKVAVVKWSSDANGVTVARSGSDTINGATSYSLGTQYSSATFVADFETNQWFAVSGLSGATTGSGSIVLATSPTITTPVISSIVNTGTLTLPTSTDTLVGRATTDTLTNKTLTSPTLTTPALGTPASGVMTNVTGINYDGYKNRIINGAMVIDQRNAGASVTINSAAWTYIVDRFCCLGQSADGVYTAQQSSTAPAGFANSLKITVTTADASVGATQIYTIRQTIEGYNIADLNWGTANAQSCTLSFWVRSSQTGTFSGCLNNEGTASYPFIYVISVADTWEKKTVTLAGPTSGTWGSTNSNGIRITWSLGVGTTYSGTANIWNYSTEYFAASSSVNLINTINATLYITGVQLEKGSTATSFDYRPYSAELAMCQRYYYARGGTITAPLSNTVDCRAYVAFKSTMRTTPTVTATQVMGGGSQVIEGTDVEGVVIGVNASTSRPVQFSTVVATAEL